MKTAVVLFNLGGPDGPDAVRPFLFNLFNDPAIIGLPQPLRWCLAKLISARRAPVAREIYANLGGGSPLLPNTEIQAGELEARLSGIDGETRCFIAMRYWHPLIEAAVRAVKSFAPDRIVLLPLYPQFSTTTTGSSFDAWKHAADAVGIDAPTHSVCCYPDSDGFVAALADGIRPALEAARGSGRPRVLFSAHGLPKKIVAAGDPYQWQVERTASAVAAKLDDAEIDWLTCYQSRVGPLEWIGPSTEEEIVRAGNDGVPLVMVPLAFVSEHSETLVELDIEYRTLAESHGVPAYHRVPTVDAAAPFIDTLARAVEAALTWPKGTLASDSGIRLCPATYGKCRCTHRAA
jgi:ferrochelatase